MLRHESLRNVEVATAFGKITLNDKGETEDLSPTQQKSLGSKVRGFTYINKEDEKKKRKEAEKKAEEKKKEEDAKQAEREKEAEEAKEVAQADDKIEDPVNTTTPKTAKKTTAKKAPAKKTASKSTATKKASTTKK